MEVQLHTPPQASNVFAARLKSYSMLTGMAKALQSLPESAVPAALKPGACRARL